MTSSAKVKINYGALHGHGSGGDAMGPLLPPGSRAAADESSTRSRGRAIALSVAAVAVIAAVCATLAIAGSSSSSSFFGNVHLGQASETEAPADGGVQSALALDKVIGPLSAQVRNGAALGQSDLSYGRAVADATRYCPPRYRHAFSARHPLTFL